MVQYLFDNYIVIYTFAGLCGLGLMLRFILDMVYKHLVKESDNVGATKNRSLKHMKMKFETCYKLKIGVNNVDTFVDKNVLRYRFCGILLSTWENFSGQVLFLTLLVVPISTVFGVIFECGQDILLYSGAVGISAGTVLILVDKSINLSAKKQSIRLNLLDYFENFCKVRLEHENLHPEMLEQYRQEYFQSLEANKQVSATSAVAPMKDETKDELNRRREARRKKEEERRAQALRREEEQKRIEEARKEEERRRMEERKKLAAKRREEELLKLQEEREALEAKQAEIRKKAEEKKRENERKQQQKLEKEKILHSIEEELAVSQSSQMADTIINDSKEEPLERKEMDRLAKERGAVNQRKMTPQEEKILEDVLKEFFA
ncbi:hypothetical protein I5677_13340 [Mobilitalea sibirica]|uniref:Uncharacterized protein n=1 Tax=Mobilitalea sibirica TaxID=1462919 RepID=A0A8J7H9K4_9FIRM|nr:hypothetical protein [Mobilitalea sibirica]MBH1941881.1 hypothetical protein [Mobilitalea sibirica]